MPRDLARATRNVLHGVAERYKDANSDATVALRVTCLRAAALFNRALGSEEDA